MSKGVVLLLVVLAGVSVLPASVPVFKSDGYCPSGGENVQGVDMLLNDPRNSSVRDSAGIAHLVGQQPRQLSAVSGDGPLCAQVLASLSAADRDCIVGEEPSCDAAIYGVADRYLVSLFRRYDEQMTLQVDGEILVVDLQAQTITRIFRM